MDSTTRASVTAPSMAPAGRWALILLASLFAMATGGAWAWFHVNPPVPEFSHEFVPKSNLQGSQFKSIPVSAQAMETLANTNLLNGQFKFDRGGGGEYTVFFADWRARSAREMNVVQHTPDICWVGAGWTAVDLNLPSKVELTFDGRTIPFECRAFRAPRSQHQELTLWCTLVSGQVFDEGERFESERAGTNDVRARQSSANRRRGIEQFSQVVRHRIAGTGSKQFVRFSTEIRGDPTKTIQELVGFGQMWLELKTTRGAVVVADAH